MIQYKSLFSYITEVTIIRLNGTDQISFFIADAPTCFPELDAQNHNDYRGATFKLELRRGYAEQWLKNVGFYGFVNLITQDGNEQLLI